MSEVELLTEEEIREIAAELPPPTDWDEVGSDGMSMEQYRRIVATLEAYVRLNESLAASVHLCDRAYAEEQARRRRAAEDDVVWE
jgi:hypothetical protein